MVLRRRWFSTNKSSRASNIKAVDDLALRQGRIRRTLERVAIIVVGSTGANIGIESLNRFGIPLRFLKSLAISSDIADTFYLESRGLSESSIIQVALGGLQSDIELALEFYEEYRDSIINSINKLMPVSLVIIVCGTYGATGAVFSVKIAEEIFKLGYDKTYVWIIAKVPASDNSHSIQRENSMWFFNRVRELKEKYPNLAVTIASDSATLLEGSWARGSNESLAYWLTTVLVGLALANTDPGNFGRLICRGEEPLSAPILVKVPIGASSVVKAFSALEDRISSLSPLLKETFLRNIEFEIVYPAAIYGSIYTPEFEKESECINVLSRRTKITLRKITGSKNCDVTFRPAHGDVDKVILAGIVKSILVKSLGDYEVA